MAAAYEAKTMADLYYRDRKYEKNRGKHRLNIEELMRQLY